MVARIPRSGLWVLSPLTLQVVLVTSYRQQIVVQFETALPASPQVFLQRWLMRQQRIHCGRYKASSLTFSAGTTQQVRTARWIRRTCSAPVHSLEGSPTVREHQHRRHRGQESLLALGQRLFQKSDPDPGRRSNSSPNGGRRTSGCARLKPASHRLPHPFGLSIPKTSCPEDGPFPLRRSASLPAGTPTIHRAQHGHHPLCRAALRAIASSSQFGKK